MLEPGVFKPSSVQQADVLPIVVALGASAGGLEAFELFLKSVPNDSGLAFVVIQHLDPNQKGILPELLQRTTAMGVEEATEGRLLKANTVYVIPSNRDLNIVHGKLRLNERNETRGLHLSINTFFKSLAEDQQAKAIAIVFSGMGDDGSLGLRAIKDKGGFCLVQSPDSAKFNPMPLNAINAGLADVVAAPEDLWPAIAAHLAKIPLDSPQPAQTVVSLQSHSNLEEIVRLLRERTGNDFSHYKSNTIYRRIERRMGLHQLTGINDYLKYLWRNPLELDLLFKELLIGVTHFFRDPEVWEQLKTQVLPQLLAQYPNGRDLRAWIAGCSSGEEAYSLAMIFRELMAESDFADRYHLQIFATDLDADTIQKARNAQYPLSIEKQVSPARLKQFFVLEKDGYRISKVIREMVIFAQQNVISDPPFTKLDLVSCRNLLIYLDAELQSKIIPLFHYALRDKGILLLGSAESLNNHSDLFKTLDSRLRLFQRYDQAYARPFIDFPNKYLPVDAMTVQNKEIKQTSLQTLVDQLLLQYYSPPAVLINADGDILHINGRTGKYLELPAGKANLNIFAMARDGLHFELISAIKQAQFQVEAVVKKGLSLDSQGGQLLNLSVQKISSEDLLNGLLIVVFTDVPNPPVRRRSRKANSIEQQDLLTELQQARTELQTQREERQTSQEELKSANEELQSTNEELQSTNEELTTSKEEMQSLNEELQTMNVELQSKVTDLSGVNNDMNNLLNSMEVATIFLDNQLNIRRFTNHATKLFKLISGDNGRPLSDIVTDLDYPELQADIKAVLSTLVFMEKQIKTHDDRWYKVRIMPYRTMENVIDGVVATFIDISETKKLEALLRSKQS